MIPENVKQEIKQLRISGYSNQDIIYWFKTLQWFSSKNNFLASALTGIMLDIQLTDAEKFERIKYLVVAYEESFAGGDNSEI